VARAPARRQRRRLASLDRARGGRRMIDGVKIVPLRQIVDERGKIMHMLKATDEHFIAFGEIYFSCSWPGVVKAWHIHRSMTINNAVVSGRAKLVMYDLRPQSPTHGELQEVFLGEDNYVLVQIPPGVANGYKAYGDKMVILANAATEPHEPDEMERIDPFTTDIPYDWSLRHG
jgi:dTDP-4-dehydrorhamnose 3,5-epimerase